MKKKENEKIIIALTKLIELFTTNLEIENELNKLKLDDWKRCNEEYDFQVCSGDSESWPDDFEEEWE
tara:strand:+ start:1012 stop:1212 length:201 start_codon:yes stop_codon:yes gene_type:complete